MKKYRLLLGTLLPVSTLGFSVVSCFNSIEEVRKKEKVEFENTIKELGNELDKANNKILTEFNEFFSFNHIAIYNENERLFFENVKSFYEENYSKLQNQDLKKFYQKWRDKLLEIDRKWYLRDLENMVNFSAKILKLVVNIHYWYDMSYKTFYTKFIDKSKNENIYEVKESLRKIKEFNNLDMSKLDLSEKCDFIKVKYLNDGSDFFHTEKDTFRNTIEIKKEFDKHLELFKEDAWMVVPKEDLVDTSNFSFDNVPVFIERDGLKNNFIRKFYGLANEDLNNHFQFFDYENKDWFEETKNLSEEEWNKIIDLGDKYKEKGLDLIKNIVGSIISKKWDLEKVVKALSKYLIIKNDYTLGRGDLRKITFLSLEDEISHFNCQGYSEFIYATLKLLGYENVEYEGDYYYRETKEKVGHINNTYIINNKTYIIDVTFADKYNSADDLFRIEDINNKINKFILIPIKDYLNPGGNYMEIYVGYSIIDDTEVFIN